MNIHNLTYICPDLENNEGSLMGRIKNNIPEYRNSLLLLNAQNKTTKPSEVMNVLYYVDDSGYMAPVNSLVKINTNDNTGETTIYKDNVNEILKNQLKLNKYYNSFIVKTVELLIASGFISSDLWYESGIINIFNSIQDYDSNMSDIIKDLYNKYLQSETEISDWTQPEEEGSSDEGSSDEGTSSTTPKLRLYSSRDDNDTDKIDIISPIENSTTVYIRTDNIEENIKIESIQMSLNEIVNADTSSNIMTTNKVGDEITLTWTSPGNSPYLYSLLIFKGAESGTIYYTIPVLFKAAGIDMHFIYDENIFSSSNDYQKKLYVWNNSSYNITFDIDISGNDRTNIIENDVFHFSNNKQTIMHNKYDYIEMNLNYVSGNILDTLYSSNNILFNLILTSMTDDLNNKILIPMLKIQSQQSQSVDNPGNSQTGYNGSGAEGGQGAGTPIEGQQGTDTPEPDNGHSNVPDDPSYDDPDNGDDNGESSDDSSNGPIYIYDPILEDDQLDSYNSQLSFEQFEFNTFTDGVQNMVQISTDENQTYETETIDGNYTHIINSPSTKQYFKIAIHKTLMPSDLTAENITKTGGTLAYSVYSIQKIEQSTYPDYNEYIIQFKNNISSTYVSQYEFNGYISSDNKTIYFKIIVTRTNQGTGGGPRPGGITGGTTVG